MRRVLTGLAATALLGAAPAAAGTIQVGLALRAGGLSVQAPAVSSSANTVQVPVTVADGRGNGAGWTLRLFGNGTITGVTARCAARSTCTLPSFTGGGQAVRAAHDTGMGVMQLVVTVTGSGEHAAPLSFGVS